MEFLGLTRAEWSDLGVSALIIVGAVVIGRVLANFMFDKGARWLVGQTRTKLDDAILDAIRPPTFWLLILVALRVAVGRLGFVPQAWDERITDTFFVLYLVVGFIFAWRLIYNFFVWYGKEMALRTESPLDEQLMPFFRRVALIILSLIGFIVLLGRFDVDVSAFVTTLGVGSLAVALAAQATLADTINGFVIMMDRPFRIGDRIEIQELNTWGDVIDVGLRSSRIRTLDNRMVIVPNSVIGKSLIVNHAYPDTQYRIQVHVGVAYGSDLELARQTMIEAVRDVEGVLPDHPVEALFLEFGDSALIFRVRWWIESYVDTRRMFDRVNTAIYKALDKAGVSIPFPQQEVYHKINPSDREQFVSLLRGLDR
jgi:small-conductance mechanosensitive channel